MKRFSFSSLRVRLILLVLLAVIPAWGLVLYTGLEQKELAAAEFQKHVFRLANLAARREEQLIEGARQILIAVAQFLRLHHGDPAECHTFLAGLLREYRRYANFGAVKSNGDVFCSGVPLSHPVNAADRGWFQRAIETRGFTIGDYQIGRITEKPVLVSAYPVIDTTDQVVAVVFAALDLKWLNQLEFDVEEELPKGTTLAQIDHRGVILAHKPEPGNRVGRPMAETNVVKTVLMTETGSIEASDMDGSPRLYTFAPVQSSVKPEGVYLILGIPKKAAFASANRILNINLSLLGVIIVLTIIGAWFGGDLLILRRVDAMVNATKRLASGDLSARTGLGYGQGELGQLAMAFDEMAVALEDHEAMRQRAEAELKSSHEQLRNLFLYLQTAREEERGRVAREIHDGLGQALTALKMDLSWLRNRLNKHLNKHQKLLFEKVNSMSTLVGMTIRDVQKISTELRPGVLDDLGLMAAIDWQAQQFQSRTGIPCHVTFHSDVVGLDQDRSTAIFRIFQETLTNVMRHAHATKVEVTLGEREEKVFLEVKDNGKGIKEEQISNPKSIGLIGIRERVRSWGGQVTIVGVQNQGTRVAVVIPLDQGENSDDQSNHS